MDSRSFMAGSQREETYDLATFAWEESADVEWNRPISAFLTKKYDVPYN
jgi:hypothetical protein